MSVPSPRRAASSNVAMAAPRAQRLARRSRPSPRSAARPATTSAAAALSAVASAAGPALAAQHRERDLRVALRIAAGQVGERAQLHSELARVQLADRRPCRRARSPSVVAPQGESSSMPGSPCTTMPCSQPSCSERLRHRLDPLRRVHADQLAPRAGRVGQRPEQVEDRAHAERAPHRARRGASPGGARARAGSRSRSASIISAACSGVSAIGTPSASSTSAEPEREEAARLPCLATAQPQAAATSAAVVEMLNVPEPSPPVPAVSTRSSRGGAHRDRRARASRAPRRRARRPSRPWRAARPAGPAICAGSASPRITSPTAASVSPALSASPASRRSIVSGDHAGTPHGEEVSRDHVARGREHRLGVELHAVQVRDIAVAQGHDLAVAIARGGDQHLRQRLDRGQRVVAARLERTRAARRAAASGSMRSTVPTLPCMSRRARSTTPP